MNIDLNVAKKALEVYDRINEQGSQDKLDKKNKTLLDEVLCAFGKACYKDDELVKALNEIRDLEKVLNYDRKKDFEVASNVNNAFDPENISVGYEYSANYEELARNAAENWEIIQTDISEKIEKISNSKITLFKKKKIEELNNELKYQAGLRDKYLSVERRENAKQECIKNGGLERLAQLKTFVHKRKSEHAQRILEEYIIRNPEILCYSKYYEHKYYSEGRSSIEGKYLSSMLRKIHDQFSKEVANEEVASV